MKSYGVTIQSNLFRRTFAAYIYHIIFFSKDVTIKEVNFFMSIFSLVTIGIERV